MLLLLLWLFLIQGVSTYLISKQVQEVVWRLSHLLAGWAGSVLWSCASRATFTVLTYTIIVLEVVVAERIDLNIVTAISLCPEQQLALILDCGQGSGLLYEVKAFEVITVVCWNAADYIQAIDIWRWVWRIWIHSGGVRQVPQLVIRYCEIC